VHDQAQVRDGQRVAVVAAGSMGLQMIAVSARAGAHVVAVEPQAERRELARAFGAAEDLDPEGWVDVVRESGGADAVIVCAGDPDLVAPAVAACATGGRVVLFAGFGDRPVVPVDVNDLHYREISLVGSEWIGTPPNQRRDRYDDAARLLGSGDLRLEQLVTSRCSFDDLEAALIGRSAFRVLKTVFVTSPGASA
jgi:threonine dehydrogenase-like Zn-dependent dehydrogenase